MARREHRPIFRQLRGKLALSYVLASVVSSLLEVSLVIGLLFWLLPKANVYGPESYLEENAPAASSFFGHGKPDREALTNWLRIVEKGVSGNWFLSSDHLFFLAVVDTQGQVIVSVGLQPVRSATPIQAQLSLQENANLRAVLNERTSHSDQRSDGRIVAITPIIREGRNVQGELVMKIDPPNTQRQMSILQTPFWFGILALLIFTTIIAVICGVGLSYLTSRGPIRRFKGLSAAADRWSRGDFSAPAHDTSKDELGQLARQLNHMAEQLQILLQTQQRLATLEERNRLARDLHDSVKQQVFALAMQIGATKGWLRRNVDAAEERLNEAQKLAHQTQHELTSLIRQLRPVALEDKGLVAALHRLTTEWPQQAGIHADLRMEGAQTLPSTVEDALFRVAQEALANVARHSKATLVQMILTITDDSGTLSVIDNGQGFDTTHHKPLGIGLSSMQERMKTLGGDVQVESTPGRGTRVVAHCKLSSGDTGYATAAPDDGTAGL